MTQPFRMPTGGRVDRSRPISFTFDGKRLQGLKGYHTRLGSAR